MHEIRTGINWVASSGRGEGPTKHCVMTLTRLRKETKHSILMRWRDEISISYTNGFTKMCNIWRVGGGGSNHRRKSLITSCDKARRITGYNTTLEHVGKVSQKKRKETTGKEDADGGLIGDGRCNSSAT
eukprot:scaffold4822_cov93-Skeletonema_dohrnii-CCMP3373.AAC.2